jgi:glycosyltransferase involved in cell wall biosynthesis
LFQGAGYRRFRDYKRQCIHAADAVICISETTRQDLLDEYGLSPAVAFVVPLACSEVFRELGPNEEYSGGVEGPFLLYVGGRGIHKNFGRLIEAYSTWSLCHEVSLVVVGSSWSRSEIHDLAEAGVRDEVRLLADVSDRRLRQLYNHALALVYPSLYEGFGIPLLEAMSCGCPVIASRIPSTLEVAGRYALYFEPTEVEDLRTALDQALYRGREPWRVALGTALVRQYSWDETATRTLGVYETCMRRAPGLGL